MIPVQIRLLAGVDVPDTAMIAAALAKAFGALSLQSCNAIVAVRGKDRAIEKHRV